ncbi:TPA: hypothetical protein HL452_22590 [Escherichia coli]|uniref:hypothetical protein n=1 Tax=Enterobacteriaceae TaxID=543 RepID=UPI00101CBD29|nr:hypothetical protein [Escherichia coli]EAW6352583.1 hypothetical protein [Salmonella enterica]EBX2689157.1 hypothetical protein [Salmonella enterica subsp. enterica serovar Enteritidis]EGJ0035065.1 hypothetical protein [Salmonella enterica]RYH85931.1 hypothetical protein EVY45_25105 [Escherichia coli]HAJ0472120.1 hypothetical protein [Escherichia coli]
MKESEQSQQEKKEVRMIKLVMGGLIALVVIGIPALGFMKFIFLLWFLAIVLSMTLAFRRLPKNKDNQIPMMMLGGFIGIIIGACVVIYSVHELNEACDVPDDGITKALICYR